MKILMLLIMWVLRPLKSIAGVVLVGPMMSITARGSYAKTITYSVNKGVQYAKKWFTPHNPQSTEQTNMRTAVTLAVAYWKTPLAAPTIAAYNAGAAGTGMSGFALYMGRALDQYIIQITVAVTPASVVVANVYPDDVFTWT